MSEEEQLRKEVENEVFNDITPEAAADAIEEIQVDESDEKVEDPWENVSPVIREEFEGLKGKLSTFEQMEYRLKQAESRLGGVLNELHTAKEAAKQVTEAPSAKQIQDASESQEEWDALKDDFSEWAKAIEYKIAIAKEDVLSKIPAAPDNEPLRIEMIGGIVSLKHPDWETINQEPDFIKWREAENKVDSWKPFEIVAMLDEYKKYKADMVSPKDIIESRKQRLGSAEIVKGRPMKAVKSEDDMSPEELRQLLAEQVWAQ